MRFDDLKLRTKTLIPLFGMAVVFAGVIAVGAFKLNNLGERYAQVTTGVDPAILRMARVTRVANEMGRDVYRVLVNDPNDPATKYAADEFRTSRTRGDRMFDEAIQLNPAAADGYRALKDRFDKLHDADQAPFEIGLATPGLADPNLAPADIQKMAEASRRLAILDAEVTGLAADIVTLNSRLEADNAKLTATLRRETQNTVLLMIGMGLVAILGGLAIAAWTAGAKIAAPLVRLSERMKRLAAGDLTVEVEGQMRADEVGAMAKAVQVFKDNALKAQAMEEEARGLREATEAQRETTERERAARAAELADVVQALAGGLQRLADGVLTHRLNEAFGAEYEQLRQDYNAAMDKVQTALSAVIASAQGVNSGAGEITQAADDMSRRTEQQAASLEETAAALDEITATVRRTAEGAQNVRTVVSRARGDAEASGEIVDKAVQAMSAIERSAGEISQIIGVIDEIAFQTNLLALNAGVEAARAGDAGKGFAVVASEVRALAQRSAEAAKEIKALIATSAEEVGHGVQLVGQAGQALRRIADQVAQINGVVEEISHSTQEQATGLAQVNTAINQMDQAIQQNAAMVEESTAASHGLAHEAGVLNGLTRGFQVGEGAEAGGRARSGAHPVHAAQRRAASFGRGG